jgi:uncharacterized membrane protein YgcG
MGDFVGTKVKVLLTAICVLAGSIILSNTPVQAAPLAFKYKWSDGRAVSIKNMAKSKYGDEYGVPDVEVTLPITDVEREVKLQYMRKGKWLEEDIDITQDGEVSLSVYPVYDDGSWLSGTWDYRIVVLPESGQPNFKKIRFKIKFSSGSSSGGSSSGGSSSGGSSSGGSSSGGSSYVGWNLEDLQDHLGYDPRTVDCSGDGRDVWWASNWWVVGQYGSAVVVSKARGYCS